MPRYALGLLLLLFTGQLLGATATSPVQREIDALLVDLRTSGCEFNRNGSWHNGEEASKHLAQKLDYIQKELTLSSVEQFIDVAASKSSMSGKPYLIRCQAGPTAPAAEWLRERLKAMRASRAEKAAR